MRFAWSEEQMLLREMLDRYATDRRAAGASAPNGFDRSAWRELAELGLLGLPFSEADGGSGGSAIDVLLIMEAFGRGLVRLPYVSAIILAGGLLRAMGSEEQKARLLPGLIGGDTLLALGFAEVASRYNPADVSTKAVADGADFILSGRKIAVLGAPGADACLVSARTSGEQRDRGGISLFMVPREACVLRPFVTIDGMDAADLVLEDVRVPADALLGTEGAAYPALVRALDEATAAVCADMVGIMGMLNEKSLEFARTRNAFGQPIAQFQAIQHRLVDMRVAYEMASAIALKAASHLADGQTDANRAVAACKAVVNEEAGFVGKTAVQMHGAIGITEELDIGHYFKRLTALQLAFGSADHHLRRCAEIDRGKMAREPHDGH